MSRNLAWNIIAYFVPLFLSLCTYHTTSAFFMQLTLFFVYYCYFPCYYISLQLVTTTDTGLLFYNNSYLNYVLKLYLLSKFKYTSDTLEHWNVLYETSNQNTAFVSNAVIILHGNNKGIHHIFLRKVESSDVNSLCT